LIEGPDYLLSILAFVLLVGAFYVLISRKRMRGECVGFVLAIIAALLLLDGGLLLAREYGRRQQAASALAWLSAFSPAPTALPSTHPISRLSEAFA